MAVRLSSSPFGSSTRTRVLLVLSMRSASHARELARLTGSSLSVVQHALRTLERDGLVTRASSGRRRRVTLDASHCADQELLAYLRRLFEREPDLAGRLDGAAITPADRILPESFPRAEAAVRTDPGSAGVTVHLGRLS
jgi:DNA-binding transcriptional ArsR family regulator